MRKGAIIIGVILLVLISVGCVESEQNKSTDSDPIMEQLLQNPIKEDLSELIESLELEREAAKYTDSGWANYNSKEYSKAISDFSKAIELDPDQPAPYFGRGVVYDSSEKYSKAISDFSKAIELGPKIADVYRKRAFAYAGSKEYSKAISDFSKAIELDPEDAFLYTYRAVLYTGIGEHEKAQQDLDKAKMLEPILKSTPDPTTASPITMAPTNPPTTTPAPKPTLPPTTQPAVTSYQLEFYSFGLLPNAKAGTDYEYSFCKPDLALTSDLCGAPFDETYDPLGGNPPYTFTVSGQPMGLIMNLNGILAGTIPEQAIVGEYDMKVCVKDTSGDSVCLNKVLEVEEKGIEGSSWTGIYTFEFFSTSKSGTTTEQNEVAEIEFTVGDDREDYTQKISGSGTGRGNVVFTGKNVGGTSVDNVPLIVEGTYYEGLNQFTIQVYSKPLADFEFAATGYGEVYTSHFKPFNFDNNYFVFKPPKDGATSEENAYQYCDLCLLKLEIHRGTQTTSSTTSAPITTTAPPTTTPAPVQEDARTYFNKGVDYYNSGEYSKAISEYNKAIELEPDNAGAYLNRGLAYKRLENYDKAISDYTKSLELEPDNAYVYQNRGAVYGAMEEYSKAISDYSKQIELEPDNAVAYYNRGLAYKRLEEYEKAISDYTKAIEIDPDNANAYTYRNRGYSYIKLEEYSKAISDYTKAIELDPTYAGAYQNRGLLYQIIGENEKAQLDLDKAGELDPKYK